MNNTTLISKIFSYDVKIKRIKLQVENCCIECKYGNCQIIAAGESYNKALYHLLDALEDLSDKGTIPDMYYSI